MNQQAKELKAFLDAIAKNPRDLGTRLVYADWLDEHDEPELAAEQRGFELAKHDAEQWLRCYASKMNSYDTPDVAFDNLIKGLKSGEVFAHGTDLHGLHDLDDASELREKAELYLSRPIDDWDNFTFSCSC